LEGFFNRNLQESLEKKSKGIRDCQAASLEKIYKKACKRGFNLNIGGDMM
jgi:hypothetical protein